MEISKQCIQVSVNYWVLKSFLLSMLLHCRSYICLLAMLLFPSSLCNFSSHINWIFLEFTKKGTHCTLWTRTLLVFDDQKWLLVAGRSRQIASRAHPADVESATQQCLCCVCSRQRVIETKWKNSWQLSSSKGLVPWWFIFCFSFFHLFCSLTPISQSFTLKYNVWILLILWMVSPVAFTPETCEATLTSQSCVTH